MRFLKKKNVHSTIHEVKVLMSWKEDQDDPLPPPNLRLNGLFYVLQIHLNLKWTCCLLLKMHSCRVSHVP